MYRTRAHSRRFHQPLARLLLLALTVVCLPACAQVSPQATPASTAATYTADEIARLVEPVALYPDDLLAIVLPASTYPLQIVQAQRFTEALAGDPSLQPDETWDDSVVALLNYPEVLKLLNDDLDWTAALGQAVLDQQPEVIAAIEGFRRRALAAGNLRSDDRQVIETEGERVYIRPANPEVIYVPYYDPAVVTVYRSTPAYYYYPRGYPVYYYPYPLDYTFASGFFWGVTSYYSLGWGTRHVHVHHYDYHAHPYYGRPHLYRHDRHYYRRQPKEGHNRHHYSDGGRPGGYHGDRPYRDYSDRRRAEGDRSRYDDRWQQARHGDPTQREDRNPRYRRDAGPDSYWRPDYRRTGARPGSDSARWQRAAGDRSAPRRAADRSAAGAPDPAGIGAPRVPDSSANAPATRGPRGPDANGRGSDWRRSPPDAATRADWNTRPGRATGPGADSNGPAADRAGRTGGLEPRQPRDFGDRQGREHGVAPRNSPEERPTERSWQRPDEPRDGWQRSGPAEQRAAGDNARPQSARPERLDGRALLQQRYQEANRRGAAPADAAPVRRGRESDEGTRTSIRRPDSTPRQREQFRSPDTPRQAAPQAGERVARTDRQPRRDQPPDRAQRASAPEAFRGDDRERRTGGGDRRERVERGAGSRSENRERSRQPGPD